VCSNWFHVCITLCVSLYFIEKWVRQIRNETSSKMGSPSELSPVTVSLALPASLSLIYTTDADRAQHGYGRCFPRLYFKTCKNKAAGNTGHISLAFFNIYSFLSSSLSFGGEYLIYSLFKLVDPVITWNRKHRYLTTCRLVTRPIIEKSHCVQQNINLCFYKRSTRTMLRAIGILSLYFRGCVYYYTNNFRRF